MSKKTRKVVLLVIPTNGNDGRQRLAGIFRHVAAHPDWNLHLLNNLGMIDANMLAALDGKVSGAIIAHDTDDRMIARTMPRNLPMVVTIPDMTYLCKTRPRTLSVCYDNVALGRCIARHLSKLGNFATFGFVHNVRHSKWSVEREMGFHQAVPRSASYAMFDGDLAESALASWLQSLHKPIAIFAANDFVGSRVLLACHTARIAVPGSVCVIGCDNDDFICGSAEPNLSSVLPPFEEEGLKAAQLLDAMMSGRRAKSIILSIKSINVFTRNSTAFIPPATQLVARADEFIRLNACKGICAKDVIEHMRVSRSLMNLRFRQLKGQSIQQAILAYRLDRLCELLATTNQDIASLGRSVGFNSTAHLKRLFHQRYGMTMRDWRKAAKPISGGPGARSQARPLSPPPPQAH